MKKISFQYDFIVFLYSYLRQTNLSLDRSRWGNWSELKEYYKDQIDPREVYQYILRYAGLTLPDTVDSTALDKNNTASKIKNVIYRFLGKHYLSKMELLYCCFLLSEFHAVLETHEGSYNLEIEKVRLAIARFYTGVLESKLSLTDLKRTMSVEHYLSAEHLSLVTIAEFLPRGLTFGESAASSGKNSQNTL